ncbi:MULTISPECIES: DinB family protein [Sutcliffiella]|uniref:DinB-like domain-containing protein n=1 Tax=Sutcliffiella cohnii TaxID=33932 RepID=A0A223KT37_9BACI|nr:MULTISPECIES: DinB family protein [Sutcliffiella]AST92518.1 hypothetical protein BC6307_15075 [Sutcliffiella cohnii]MED4019038.1 DinB family protein [Sutcliffiella cohnii]WBL13763.1 DinB family protein [Sutcliffiella sp. NC1]
MSKTFQQFAETLNAVQMLSNKDESILLEPIGEGKWSQKEIIAHLYYWDKFNLEVMVPKMSDGANLPQFPDHDEYNKLAIDTLEKYTVHTIIQYFVETRNELLQKIKNVPSDIKFTIGKGKRQYSAESFIKMFLKHDAHHIEQINGKLK